VRHKTQKHSTTLADFFACSRFCHFKKQVEEITMKVSSISKTEAFLLVLFLCCVSFVVGRSSTEIGKPAVRASRQMNELDRLQLETATKH
jgi:hypothetical protein